jgi:F0F1-type ATP synthase assembly protein I
MPSHSAPAEPTDGSQTELTRSLNRSAGSFELVFAPVIMALVGLWIDRTFGTMPVFTVGLAVFGAIGAGVTQYFSYHRQLEALAEQGAIVVDRPAAQYHAANRSEPRPIEVPEEHR